MCYTRYVVKPPRYSASKKKKKSLSFRILLWWGKWEERKEESEEPLSLRRKRLWPVLVIFSVCPVAIWLLDRLAGKWRNSWPWSKKRKTKNSAGYVDAQFGLCEAALIWEYSRYSFSLVWYFCLCFRGEGKVFAVWKNLVVCLLRRSIRDAIVKIN